jgi:hypothetical protein
VQPLFGKVGRGKPISRRGWHLLGYFEAGSVGAIAVPDSNPLVVYAGTGTACPRVNVSPGVGVYRSDDGGATWVHAGLRDAGPPE